MTDDMKAALDGLKDQLKDAFVDSVIQDGKDFLAANKDAQQFLADQAKDLARLGIEYAKGDENSRAKTLNEIKIVEQIIKNRLAGIAVDAEAVARAEFNAKMGQLTQILIKAVPVILSAAI
jgi:hypothetical protein